MVEEFSKMRKESNMREIGLKTKDKVMESRLSQMALVIKVISIEVSKKERANSSGLTKPLMTVNSQMVTSTDMVCTNGLTVESTSAAGKTTPCTVKVHSHGRTAESTRVTTSRIRRRVKVRSLGQMERFMKAAGLTVNNMEMES